MAEAQPTTRSGTGPAGGRSRCRVPAGQQQGPVVAHGATPVLRVHGTPWSTAQAKRGARWPTPSVCLRRNLGRTPVAAEAGNLWRSTKRRSQARAFVSTGALARDPVPEGRWAPLSSRGRRVP
jgi:hypothetical protein